MSKLLDKLGIRLPKDLAYTIHDMVKDVIEGYVEDMVLIPIAYDYETRTLSMILRIVLVDYDKRGRITREVIAKARLVVDGVYLENEVIKPW